MREGILLLGCFGYAILAFSLDWLLKSKVTVLILMIEKESRGLSSEMVTGCSASESSKRL